MSFNEEEFLKMEFEEGWPKVIKHLAETVIGVPGILESDKIAEEDDPNRQLAFTDLCKESEVNYLKN